MAYNVHEFKSGDKLYAAQLNEMDTQIAANTAEIDTLKSSTVTSWNDLTDKPFGENVELEEFIPETSVTFSTGGYSEGNNEFESYSFEEDQEYMIVFDGKEYPGLYLLYQGTSVIPAAGMTEEVPFQFQYVGGIYVLYVTHPGTHTVAVYKMKNVVTPVPAEYLPVGVTWMKLNGDSPFRPMGTGGSTPFSKAEFIEALNKGPVYLVSDFSTDGKYNAADMIIGFNMNGSTAQITYISVGTDGQATLQTKTGLTFLK